MWCGPQELDSAFRDVLGSDWTIKNDERVKYVGKLEVESENQTLKVCASAAAQAVAFEAVHALTAAMPCARRMRR